MGFLLSKDAFRSFKRRLDYSEYGGAPLLGVNGICVIAHVSSTAKAIRNAIRVAAEFSAQRVNESIVADMATRLDQRQFETRPVPF